MIQITEDYVSSETAKLLKEKGFDEYCKSVYHFGSVCSVTSLGYHDNEGYDEVIDEKQNSDFGKYDNAISAPTLQMAMKWLREVHSLYIDIVTSFSQDGICYTFSCFNTMDLIQGTKGISYHEYQTHEGACEAAIKYCLENLI